MKVTPTALPDVLLLTNARFGDARGSFMETYNEKAAAEAGLPTRWVQDNFSVSSKNVVRGLHYQTIQPQGKLVRAAFGSVLDVAVDLRRSSPAFGRHIAVELHAEEGTMLWIPPGFGHGFMALTDEVGFAYKVTDYYCAAGERTILWNDPELGIAWPVAADAAIVSGKDRVGSRFADAEVFA